MQSGAKTEETRTERIINLQSLLDKTLCVLLQWATGNVQVCGCSK